MRVSRHRTVPAIVVFAGVLAGLRMATPALAQDRCAQARDLRLTNGRIHTLDARDTVVSEAAITSCIRDLRRALDDSSQTPRYIETVHRRGFRFIGPVAAPSAPSMRPTVRPPSPLVGRDAELARLDAVFATAAAGRRRLVFVTGGRIPLLGHLPGDIVIQRDNVTIFVPLGSMLLVSVVVSIVLGLLNRR